MMEVSEALAEDSPAQKRFLESHKKFESQRNEHELLEQCFISEEELTEIGTEMIDSNSGYESLRKQLHNVRVDYYNKIVELFFPDTNWSEIKSPTDEEFSRIGKLILEGTPTNPKHIEFDESLWQRIKNIEQRRAALLNELEHKNGKRKMPHDEMTATAKQVMSILALQMKKSGDLSPSGTTKKMKF
jgi:hypothetical protein